MTPTLNSYHLPAGGPLGSGRQWMSWIHRDDLVELLMEGLRNPAYKGVYNATAPKPITMAQLCSSLGTIMGRPSWLPVPDFALQVIEHPHTPNPPPPHLNSPPPAPPSPHLPRWLPALAAGQHWSHVRYVFTLGPRVLCCREVVSSLMHCTCIPFLTPPAMPQRLARVPKHCQPKHLNPKYLTSN